MKMILMLMFILFILACVSNNNNLNKDIYMEISKMDITEVTVAEFEKCVNAGFCNKKNFKTNSVDKIYNYGAKGKGNHPINGVNWYGAEEYCKWKGKRLPTEEEWELAAKGRENYKYSGSDDIDKVSWYKEDMTHEVGTKKANGYGLYDMSGNVWEWTNSWYDNNKDIRIIRGGGFHDGGIHIQIEYRYHFNPADIYYYIGFRCVQ